MYRCMASLCSLVTARRGARSSCLPRLRESFSVFSSCGDMSRENWGADMPRVRFLCVFLTLLWCSRSLLLCAGMAACAGDCRGSVSAKMRFGGNAHFPAASTAEARASAHQEISQATSTSSGSSRVTSNGRFHATDSMDVDLDNVKERSSTTSIAATTAEWENSQQSGDVQSVLIGLHHAPGTRMFEVDNQDPGSEIPTEESPAPAPAPSPAGSEIPTEESPAPVTAVSSPSPAPEVSPPSPAPEVSPPSPAPEVLSPSPSASSAPDSSIPSAPSPGYADAPQSIPVVIDFPPMPPIIEPPAPPSDSNKGIGSFGTCNSYLCSEFGFSDMLRGNAISAIATFLLLVLHL